MKNDKQLKIPFPDYIATCEEPVFEADPKFEIAEIDLVYKRSGKDRPVMRESNYCYNLLKCCWDDNKLDMVEQFNILLLDRANAVLGIYRMSTGGISGTVADPRLAFAAALKANACGMILAHNHPSQNLKPSRADEDLTLKFKEAGKMLDIKVMDHIIVTRDGYYSFADQGMM